MKFINCGCTSPLQEVLPLVFNVKQILFDLHIPIQEKAFTWSSSKYCHSRRDEYADISCLLIIQQESIITKVFYPSASMGIYSDRYYNK